LDCRHVCKTFAFHDALQAGKQKEVHRTPDLAPAGARSGQAFADTSEKLYEGCQQCVVKDGDYFED
jgi:hypothetical protein